MNPSIMEEYNPSSYDDSNLGFLNNLPAYNTIEGNDRLLDVSREAFENGGYYPLIIPWPQAQDILIPARSQKSGAIIVPAGAILAAITGWSDNGVSPNVTGNQFSFRLFDNATGNDVFYGTWGWASNVAPSLEPNLPSSNTLDVQGPLYFSDPYIVLADNSLQATIINAATTDSNMQVALHFIVPIQSTMVRARALIQGVS